MTIYSDEPNMSDTTLLVSVEDLINRAMGPPDVNVVNFKLIQMVLQILARQQRMLTQRVEIKVTELAAAPPPHIITRGRSPEESTESSSSKSPRSLAKRRMAEIKEEREKDEKPSLKQKIKEEQKEKERAEKIKQKEQEKAEKIAQREQEKAGKIALKEQEKAGKISKKEQEKAEKAALKEQEKAEKAALKEKDKAGKTALKEQEKAEKAALKEQEKAEKAALKEQAKADKGQEKEEKRAQLEKEKAEKQALKEKEKMERMSEKEKEKYLKETEKAEKIAEKEKKRLAREQEKADKEKARAEKEEARERARSQSPAVAKKEPKKSVVTSDTGLSITESMRGKEKVIIVEKGPTTRTDSRIRTNIDVVTQSQFALLEAAVKQLKEVAVPKPLALPDNQKLRSDLVKGTASLPDTMQAMQVGARVKAAETAIDRMTGLLTQLAALGAIPEDLADQVELVTEVAVTDEEKEPLPAKSRPSVATKKSVLIDPKLSQASRLGTQPSVASRLEVRPSIAPSVVMPRPSQITTARPSILSKPSMVTLGPGVTQEEMNSALRELREEMSKSFQGVVGRAATAADTALHTAMNVANKLDIALKLDVRISSLFTLVSDYAEQLSGFDAGLTTQMQSFKDQIGQMRTDLQNGLAQLENVNNNAETAAVMELTERYTELVGDLDTTLNAHNALQRLQGQLTDEMHSLVECVEMLREQKCDKDEVLDGLRDKADISRLSGLLSEVQFAAARADFERRLDLCHDKFRRQDSAWAMAIKDLSRLTDQKAELIELLSLRDLAQKQLQDLHERLRTLALALGEPKAALLTRQMCLGATCGACGASALMEPQDAFAGAPPRLPPLRATTEPEPCGHWVTAEPPLDRHTCHRFAGGSHTLLPAGGAVVRETAAAPLDLEHTHKYTGYGSDGRVSTLPNKLDIALKLDVRISSLFTLVSDYAEQLSGFDAGLTTQMQSFKDQIGQMRTDLQNGLAQLENVNNNAETAAVMELTERYTELVGDLDTTLNAHNALQRLQGQLTDEMHSLVECVEMLREQKCDKDEVLDGLRDKADISRLSGLLSEVQFAAARADFERRLDLCHDKFRRQDSAWAMAIKDLSRLTDQKAELIELLSLRDLAQKQLQDLHERLRTLALALGEPKAALLTRQMCLGATCGACGASALMEPQDAFAGAPPRLPPLRATTEPEPCGHWVTAEPPLDRHTCHRFAGGSHTLLPAGGAVVRETAAAPLDLEHTHKYTGYGSGGRLYMMEEDLKPCIECNMLSPSEDQPVAEPERSNGAGDAPDH